MAKARNTCKLCIQITELRLKLSYYCDRASFLLYRPLLIIEFCRAEAPKPMKKSKGKGKAIADADSLWAALDVEGGQAPAADGAETASEFLQEPVTAPEPSETSAPQQGAHQDSLIRAM